MDKRDKIINKISIRLKSYYINVLKVRLLFKTLL